MQTFQNKDKSLGRGFRTGILIAVIFVALVPLVRAADTDPNDYNGVTVDSNRPTGLMVNLLATPSLTTIPDTSPEFTWIFHPATPGESQSAYRIIVASTAELAGSGTGDVWDSGQVSSDASVNVDYTGTSLGRGATYFGRVQTWGNDTTPSHWSDIQSFTIESSLPQAGARSIYKASANDSSGYNWAGHYRSAFRSEVTPVSVVDKGNGDIFIDFGKDAFGYLSFHLDGSFSGKTVIVRMGEAAQGYSVNTSPGGTIRFGSVAVKLADGDRTYEAHHATTVTGLYGGGINVSQWAGAVMPFRYAELINCPATVSAADIRQHVLQIPFNNDASSFTSSDDTLNAVYNLCKYSIKATSFTGVYVDGDRERKPYEADAYINQLSHYCVDREYTMARYTYEYLLDHHTWPLEWRMHFPLMAWADYMVTGNADALGANYASLKGTLMTSRERASDGAFVSPHPGGGQADPSDIIDWPPAERDGYVLSSANPVSTVPNAFHYEDLRLMAKIATVLGKSSDATDFTVRADRIQALFAGSTFWDGSEYKDGENPTHASAHANFFPMAFGLIPSNRVDSVMAFLKTSRTIQGRTEYMPCSVYGAQYYLEALFKGNEPDHAIALMADHSTSRKRNWDNMIREGSTITTEAWGREFKSNEDWNHAWGAAPANIIPRFVLGVKPLTPGFATVQIKPQLGSGDGTNGLTYAYGKVPTIRGPVVVDVNNSPTLFRLQVEIPGNMTATISIPTKGRTHPEVLFDGDVVQAMVEDGTLVLEDVPSGKHSFSLQAND